MCSLQFLACWCYHQIRQTVFTALQLLQYLPTWFSSVAGLTCAVAGNMQNSLLPLQTQADLKAFSPSKPKLTQQLSSPPTTSRPTCFTPDTLDLLSTTGTMKSLHGGRRIAPLLDPALLHVSNPIIANEQSNIWQAATLINADTACDINLARTVNNSMFTCRGG